MPLNKAFHVAAAHMGSDDEDKRVSFLYRVRCERDSGLGSSAVNFLQELSQLKVRGHCDRNAPNVFISAVESVQHL